MAHFSSALIDLGFPGYTLCGTTFPQIQDFSRFVNVELGTGMGRIVTVTNP